MTTNYRDTLNLPKTDFSMKAGLPRKEPDILNFWEKTNLYKKIRQKYQGKELFYFMMARLMPMAPFT